MIHLFRDDYSARNLRRVAACYPVGSRSRELLGVVVAAVEQGLICKGVVRDLVCVAGDSVGFQVAAVEELEKRLFAKTLAKGLHVNNLGERR